MITVGNIGGASGIIVRIGARGDNGCGGRPQRLPSRRRCYHSYPPSITSPKIRTPRNCARAGMPLMPLVVTIRFDETPPL